MISVYTSRSEKKFIPYRRQERVGSGIEKKNITSCWRFKHTTKGKYLCENILSESVFQPPTVSENIIQITRYIHKKQNTLASNWPCYLCASAEKNSNTRTTKIERSSHTQKAIISLEWSYSGFGGFPLVGPSALCTVHYVLRMKRVSHMCTVFFVYLSLCFWLNPDPDEVPLNSNANNNNNQK